MLRRGAVWGLVLAGTAAAAGLSAQEDTLPRVSQDLVASARDFWLAADSAERATAASALRASGAPVRAIRDALLVDPRYPSDVPVGTLHRVRTAPGGQEHPYMAIVPVAYEPDRAWPVLVYLHGGVGRPAWTRPGAWWRDIDRVADPDRIVLLPAAWNESAWWQEGQAENLRAILVDIGRTYRIDHDRVHLLGVSDGGTGVYYQAFRAATPWASFLAFIGHPAVLSSPRLRVDGQMHVTNLRNRPLFVVNGGRDRRYPTESMAPFIRLFEKHGVPVTYRPKPDAGHDLSWWPDEEARIDSFITATPRDPLPDRLEWETEEPRRGRFAWVAIDELGSVPGEADLPDRNELVVDGRAGSYVAFPHRRPSGRLVVERTGNDVTVRSRGVRRFRLLLSPDRFDLDRPVRVEVNGREVFRGLARPRIETLLGWAMRDADPRLLFVAEIEIDLRS